MRSRLLIVLLVLAIAAVLVAVRAPASLVARAMAQPDVPVRLLQPRGTIWNGAAALSLHDRLLGDVAWEVRPSALLGLGLAADWRLTTAGGQLVGDVHATQGAIGVTATGKTPGSSLAPLLDPFEIALAGNIELRTVELTIDPSGIPTDARGTVTWTGGDVSYPVGTQQMQQRFPPMTGTFAPTAEDHPSLTVRNSATRDELMIMQVLDDGFVKVGITRAMTELSGQSWPGHGLPSSVVLEVEQDIF